jgi:hypothetical protein
MSKKSRLLLFVVCLLAKGAVGAETYVSFAKESLGLDLTTLTLGTVVDTNSGFEKVEGPSSGGQLPDGDGLTWMVNDISAKYRHDFPNRTLKYGFRDGKLIAVRVSIGAFGAPGVAGGNIQQELIDGRRKELVQIQDEYWKVRKAEKAATEQSCYEIRYGAMCAPSPESLFLMEMQITLTGEKTK